MKRMTWNGKKTKSKINQFLKLKKKNKQNLFLSQIYRMVIWITIKKN